MLGIAGKVPLMVFDGTNNTGTEALTIWLRRHQKSTSHEVIQVHNQHWHRRR